jgi:hypothetical protein
MSRAGGQGSNALPAPCPSLEGKREQDLRDTCVTWLARAGATWPRSPASPATRPQSIHQILKHYLAITPELADSAIAKLVAWMNGRNGGMSAKPIDDFEDEPEDRCTNPGGHEFECTGTAYGGDDARWFGEGRSFCIYCGADGDG